MSTLSCSPKTWFFVNRSKRRNSVTSWSPSCFRLPKTKCSALVDAHMSRSNFCTSGSRARKPTGYLSAANTLKRPEKAKSSATTWASSVARVVRAGSAAAQGGTAIGMRVSTLRPSPTICTCACATSTTNDTVHSTAMAYHMMSFKIVSSSTY